MKVGLLSAVAFAGLLGSWVLSLLTLITGCSNGFLLDYALVKVSIVFCEVRI